MVLMNSPKFPTEGKEFFGWIVDSVVNNGRILYKVWLPQFYGKNVKKEDLPYVPALNPPGMNSGTTSPGAMDVGQVVKMGKDMAQGSNGFGTILGLLHPVTSSDSTMAGANFSLSDIFGKPLDAITRNIQLPPNLKITTNENGVQITQMIEKGLHSLSTLYGLASHGAQSPLAYVQVPPPKGVSTALDAAGSQITSTMVANVPGTSFSIGQLFSMLSPDLLSQLTKNLPPEVSEALTTLTNLTQQYDTSSVLGGTRVNPVSFLERIVTALQDLKTPDALLDTINSFLSDISNLGTSNMNHYTTSAGAFGSTNLTISPLGDIQSLLDDVGTKALGSFTSLINNFQSPKGTLFDTVNNLPGMIDRLAPEVSQGLVGMINTLQTTPAPSAANWVK